MLLTLGDGERHGYTLEREILHRTGGNLNLGSGVLYRTRTWTMSAGANAAPRRQASAWRRPKLCAGWIGYGLWQQIFGGDTL